MAFEAIRQVIILNPPKHPIKSGSKKNFSIYPTFCKSAPVNRCESHLELMNKKLKKLVDGCLKNNRRSQEKLYKYFFDDMFRPCYKMLRNEDDALDALNQGFLKVFVKLEHYSGQGTLNGWIYKIVYFTTLDYISSRKKRFEELGDEAMSSVFDAQIDNALQLEDIKTEIENLPKATKVVFELYAIEGYTHAEIAERLGISTGTSKWHLSKAREYLKAALINDYKEFMGEFSSQNLKSA